MHINVAYRDNKLDSWHVIEAYRQLHEEEEVQEFAKYWPNEIYFFNEIPPEPEEILETLFWCVYLDASGEIKGAPWALGGENHAVELVDHREPSYCIVFAATKLEIAATHNY